MGQKRRPLFETKTKTDCQIRHKFLLTVDREKRQVKMKADFFDLSGAPGLVRPPRPGPCLDFGFQYVLIRNNRPKNLG